MDFYVSHKCPEKLQKIHAPEGVLGQKMGQRVATRAPGAPLARPPSWSWREAVWVGPTPSSDLPWPLWVGPYLRRGHFPNSHQGAVATLCSSPGELISRLFWPPVRGDRRHRHQH